MEEQHFYLTDVIGAKIVLRGKKIGKLSDLIVHAGRKTKEIESIYVGRNFGDPSLIIPWKSVLEFSSHHVTVDIEDIKPYEVKPSEHDVLLKDQVLDKKIIDTKDREVEIVYDIRLVLQNKKLYVGEADLSKYRMLRRMGLKTIAGILHNIAGRMQEKYLPWDFVQPLPSGMTSFKGDIKISTLRERLAQIHPVELANILEELDYKQRSIIFEKLGLEKASSTFEEIDPPAQRELISTLPQKRVLELLKLMTPGQIADVFSALPLNQSRPLLKLIDVDAQTKVKKILEKQDEHILNLATSKLIIYSPKASVKKAQDEYATIAKDKEVTMYLYIVDEKNHLVGVIDIKELLGAKEENFLGEIMESGIVSLKPSDSYRDAQVLFEKYDFRAIPIVDKENKLLGAVNYKDLVKLKHKFLR